MAASRSMLESLLARVRQRATEPRGPQPALPRQGAPAGNAATSPPARAAAQVAPVAVPEEEIEEYDDELIEILDDDVASDSSPPPPSSHETAPLELRASAPSLELRRRALPPSSPNQVAAPRAAAPAPAAVYPAARAPAAPVTAAAALRAEVVARRPVPSGAVVQAQAARPAMRSSFLELLDASLDLGK
ncbi:MAG: hypothetical protein ABI895_22615 [Deltaproteobacteria bacterium]